MSRFQKSLNKYRNSSVLLIIILISLLLMSINTGKFNFSPKKIGNSFFSIFQIGVSGTVNYISDTFNSIGELKKLKSEHDSLLEKLQDYQRRERDFVELKEENIRLKQQLDFKNTSGYIFKSAQIIAHEPGNIFNSFVINKGSSQGIERNMPVIAFQNGFRGLVGKIIEVGTFTSKVIPIIDNSSYVAARLLDSRYEGLVNGLANEQSTLIMNYVSKNAFKYIKEGDLVVTSGLQSIYPRGIYIGRIKNIEVPEWQTSLVINVASILDFSKLEYVLVLTGEK